MENETKPSTLNSKLMVIDKSLPEVSCPKIDAVHNKLLKTKQASAKDSPLLIKCKPDVKRVEELSAKEQEGRLKFKEKYNKLRKVPMSPQPIINVSRECERLAEGDLTIENVKGKLKQIFSSLFKEPLPSTTPPLQKSLAKKQSNSNDINVSVRTRPIASALHRFNSCFLQMKRNASMICKSVRLLSEQNINNQNFVFISKDKHKSDNTSGNKAPAALSTNKLEKKHLQTPEKVWETREEVKPVNRTQLDLELKQVADDIADRIKEEKSMQLIREHVAAETTKAKLRIRSGFLSNILRNYNFFNQIPWFSFKKNDLKMRMTSLSSTSKLPIRWRYGFVILGTIIPLYYTYYKIVTDNKLTLPLIRKN